MFKFHMHIRYHFLYHMVRYSFFLNFASSFQKIINYKNVEYINLTFICIKRA